jgi:hypothetical protein
MAGANWWISNFPGGPGQPAAPAYGGGGADILTARDPLDAKRMAAGFAPGASYPDGYLGTITNRREDKDLAVLQSRLTPNSYQRGVHVGEIVPKGAYYWEPGFNPQSGIERQMQAQPVNVEGGRVMQTPRHTVSGDPVEMLVNDGKFGSLNARQRDAEFSKLGGDPAKNPVTVVNPTRRAQMAPMLPRWSGA